MDKSKINQTQLDFSCGLGLANLNLNTGRLLFEIHKKVRCMGDVE